MCGYDLVNEVFSWLIIGSKYRCHEFFDEVAGMKWFDIKWSVVDIFHPQFLPSSFKL